jgi:hypothetical protein
MTPQQLKNAMETAVKKKDSHSALSLIAELISKDYFIGKRAQQNRAVERFGDGTRVLDYPGRCNECGVNILAGDKAYWEKGVGVWHVTCWDK